MRKTLLTYVKPHVQEDPLAMILGIPYLGAAMEKAGLPVELTVDREEILVVGQLPAPEAGDSAAAEALTRIRSHREHTRAGRIAIAEEAEATFGRKVAWGARCGDRSEVFTSIAVRMNVPA